MNRAFMLRRRAMMAAADKKLWLYRDGDECIAVTGGWSVSVPKSGFTLTTAEYMTLS